MALFYYYNPYCDCIISSISINKEQISTRPGFEIGFTTYDLGLIPGLIAIYHLPVEEPNS